MNKVLNIIGYIQVRKLAKYHNRKTVQTNHNEENIWATECQLD